MKQETELEVANAKAQRYKNSLERALVLLGTMVLDDKDLFHKLVVHEFLSRARKRLRKGSDE